MLPSLPHQGGATNYENNMKHVISLALTCPGLLLTFLIGLTRVSKCSSLSLAAFKSTVINARTDEGTRVSSLLSSPNSLTVFGTYACDFNAIEYAQKLACYLPKLKILNVETINFIVNGTPQQATKLAELTNLPYSVNLYSDAFGVAGREFGCSTGWLPDNTDLSPYFKLYMMLFGIGASNTLPSVIKGYIGDPDNKQEWVQDAMRVNCNFDRFPTNGLVISSDGKSVIENNVRIGQ